MTAYHRFKPYRIYRSTGVNWPNEIPAHWGLERLKYAAQIVAGQSPPSTLVREGVDGLPFLQGNAEFGALNPTPRQSCDAATKHAQAGDILLSVRAPVGAMNVADQKYGIGRGLCAISIGARVHPQFGFYALSATRKLLDAVASGSTYDAVTASQVGDLPQLLPPQPEQRAIAGFLDRETGRIDALVAKNERLIELLHEKRTALITQAVTKGLDPNVPMKDSGVGWLDRVPRHWVVQRADSFLKYDKVQVEPSDISDELVFHYSIPSVQETGDGRLEPPDDIQSGKLRITGQRLLVSKLNPRKGVVLIALDQDVPTVCSTEFVPFEVIDADLRWAYYLMLADTTRQRLSAVVRSATRSHQRAEVSEISKMWHAIPPKPEQQAIAAFLDQEAAQIHALVGKVQEAIGRLKEFRSALVSAAVTGAIDVRQESCEAGAA